MHLLFFCFLSSLIHGDLQIIEALLELIDLLSITLPCLAENIVSLQ